MPLTELRILTQALVLRPPQISPKWVLLSISQHQRPLRVQSFGSRMEQRLVTRNVIDLRPGSTGSSITNLTELNGSLYFIGTNGADQTVWKTDGTAVGTVQLLDTRVGSSDTAANLIKVGSKLFFSSSSTAAGQELWVSDGTAAGTSLVRDINSGTGSSSPALLVNNNGVLYFTATTSGAGTELWKSDGTSAGTVLVRDIRSGTSSSSIAEITAMGEMFTLERQGNNIWIRTLGQRWNGGRDCNGKRYFVGFRKFYPYKPHGI